MEDTQIDLLKHSGFSVQDAESLSVAIAEYVKEKEDPLEAFAKIKCLEVALKSAKDQLLDEALAEASKYGKDGFRKNGAIMTIAEAGITYDYSDCNDPVLFELMEESQRISAEITKRQMFLKNMSGPMSMEYPDKATGELNVFVINPPIRKSTTTINVRLAK